MAATIGCWLTFWASFYVGVALRKQNLSTHNRHVASVTLSTTIQTWPDSGSNPALRGERPATKRLNYGRGDNRKCVAVCDIVLRNGAVAMGVSHSSTELRFIAQWSLYVPPV